MQQLYILEHYDTLKVVLLQHFYMNLKKTSPLFTFLCCFCFRFSKNELCMQNRRKVAVT